MNNISIQNRKIKVREFQLMRNSTGWDPIEDNVVEKALENDLFSTCIYDDELLIGMGRVIGDGAIYFYIQDVIVLPQYKGEGIGRMIMENIEKFIAQSAHKNSFIGLMAAEGVHEFYKNYGYKVRPDNAPGMFKVLKV